MSGTLATTDAVNIAYSRLTPCEQEIIDLHDAGLTPRQIAERVPYSRACILHAVRYYGNLTCEQERHDRGARTGSQRLAAAIAAIGKVFA